MEANPQPMVINFRENVGTRQEHLADEGSPLVLGPGSTGPRGLDQAVQASVAGVVVEVAAPPVAVTPVKDGMEKYVADVEISLLKSALDQSHGVQTRAADLLKISYRSFRHLMKKYEL